MFRTVNNSEKQRGVPFKPGVSGNPSGRPRGSRNKRSLANIEAAQATGQMPPDFLLLIMRENTQPLERRLEAAKIAAPYCHARLASSEHSGPQDKPAITGIEVVFVTPKPRATRFEADVRFRGRLQGKADMAFCGAHVCR